jgi:citrate synthase
LADLLDKKAFDKSGLIYGMGHAVYSISDPRALLFRSFVEKLSVEKGMTDEYGLYSRVESSPRRLSVRSGISTRV